MGRRFDTPVSLTKNQNRNKLPHMKRFNLRRLGREFTLLEKIFTGCFVIALLMLPLALFVSLREANYAQMEKHTEEISTAITNLRRYYATNVIERLQQSSGKAVFSEDYKNVHGGIPIPATFSIEMGELFGRTHKDTTVAYSFVSDYPFANRTRPPLDEFQSQAVKAFRANSNLQEFEISDVPFFGSSIYRRATPVIMQQACVYCHNGHPQSPRRDWKVGDVRGIQEVKVGGIDTSFYNFRYLFYYFGLLTFLTIGSVIVFRRTAARLADSNAELLTAREGEARATEELQEKVNELALLAAVADRSTFGITIADARKSDMPLVYANHAFLEMTGYQSDEVLGRNCRFLQGAETDKESIRTLRETTRQGRSATVELLNYTKFGESFWNRLTIFPVGGQHGAPDFYVGYQVDVTKARKADAEREAMMLEMQETQKIESLGILVAGVAHEINNPLGIALTATSHIAESAGEIKESLDQRALLTPELREFLEEEAEAFRLVQANLRRAANLVKNFKDVAADRAQKSERRVELKQYLGTLAGTFVPLLKRARCKLSVDCEPEIHTVLDTGSFGQLITNLVVNATVHAFSGVPNPEIKIVASLKEKKITIVVSDNGIGIPPEILPQLFTPFYTTKRATGGTGLGLFIARKIAIEELGGDLTAERLEPQGSRFVLLFPQREN